MLTGWLGANLKINHHVRIRIHESIVLEYFYLLQYIRPKVSQEFTNICSYIIGVIDITHPWTPEKEGGGGEQDRF